MKVLKFGGTSVADSKSINNVISILKNNDEPLFIIVSAFGGITNLLQKCIVSKGKSVSRIINEIEERHLEVIDNLSSLDKQSSLKSFLKQNLNELEEILLKLLFSIKPPILIILFVMISDLSISDGV